MNSVVRVAGYLLLVLCFAPIVYGQRSSYDPATRGPNKQRGSFLDFALKQVNSGDTDYGCRLDVARKLAMDETVKSIGFWTLLITFGLLLLSFFMLIHQQRERSRRELIASEFLAQYHNAWVDARREAEDAIGRYNELVNTKNRSAEDLRSQLLEPERVQESAIPPNTRRDIKQQSDSSAAITSSVKLGGNGAVRRESVREIKSPMPQSTADLIAQISTLQQQLTASHDREKQLQKQLRNGQRRAPAAQPTDMNVPS